jgi:hypothetical protein
MGGEIVIPPYAFVSPSETYSYMYYYDILRLSNVSNQINNPSLYFFTKGHMASNTHCVVGCGICTCLLNPSTNRTYH